MKILISDKIHLKSEHCSSLITFQLWCITELHTSGVLVASLESQSFCRCEVPVFLTDLKVLNELS